MHDPKVGWSVRGTTNVSGSATFSVLLRPAILTERIVGVSN